MDLGDPGGGLGHGDVLIAEQECVEESLVE
jgi:hypothetical protein